MPERTAEWEKADSHSSGGERVSHSVICQGQPPINTFYCYNTFLCVFKPTELKYFLLQLCDGINASLIRGRWSFCCAPARTMVDELESPWMEL